METGVTMAKMKLEQFIDKYGKDIYSFCCYLSKNTQEADDLYQDSFVKILSGLGFPEEDEDAKNLMLSVAVRLWKDKKRKFARRKRILEEEYIPQKMLDDYGNGGDSPEEYIIQSKATEYIRQCIDRLPEKMKLVILLYYMEHRKISDIAKVLHIPPGTVKSRLHEAKLKIAKELQGNNEGGLGE